MPSVVTVLQRSKSLFQHTRHIPNQSIDGTPNLFASADKKVSEASKFEE